MSSNIRNLKNNLPTTVHQYFSTPSVNNYDNLKLATKQLTGWIPEAQLQIAIPLDATAKGPGNLYIINYYDGLNRQDLEKAKTICFELLKNLDDHIKDNIIPVKIYLYLFDYPHNLESLDKIGVNNGYMQVTGNKYSIVIYRHMFWPKVLVHELLHVLWRCNSYPIPLQNTSPRWDEAIIEAHAVTYAMKNNYISSDGYNYYLKLSQGKIGNLFNCPPEETINGGTIMPKEFDQLCLSKQKTNVLEYFFLSERIRSLLSKSK